MSGFDLAGRTALVTGASSGIGLALARELARHGARLVITARRADRLARLADELASGGCARPAVDMATYSASKAFVVSFSEAVHAEVRRLGVRVVCLCPGRTATEFAAVAGYSEARRQRLARGWRAAMSPEAVAREGIAALASGAPLRSAGAANRALVGLLRFVPRRAALAAAERIMRRQRPRDKIEP